MTLDELEEIDNTDIKVGYLYFVPRYVWGGSGEYLKEFDFRLCVGKCIASAELDYIFALVSMSVVKQDECETVINRVRNGCFGKVVNVIEMGKFKECYCVGKVVDADKIALWLTQLRLSGYQVTVDKFCKYYGYIGDWVKREKLECVKEFVSGQIYIKEPLAYVRRNTKQLRAMSDKVWFFKGRALKQGKVVFVWEEKTYRDIRLADTYCYGKTHVVSKQYTDMVLFNVREWKVVENFSD